MLHGYCTTYWSCLHQHFPRLATVTFLYQGNLEPGLPRLEQTLLEKICGIVYGGKLLQVLTTGCRAHASSSLVHFKAVHIQYATKITLDTHPLKRVVIFIGFLQTVTQWNVNRMYWCQDTMTSTTKLWDTNPRLTQHGVDQTGNQYF